MLLKLKEASEYSSQDVGTNNQNLAEQTWNWNDYHFLYPVFIYYDSLNKLFLR